MRSSKSGDRRFLSCPNRQVSKEACVGSFISVDKLESMVIAELNKLSAEYLDPDELSRGVNLCDDLRERKKTLGRDVVSLRSKVNQFSTGIRNLYLDKVKGILSESDFIDISEDFITQRQRLEAQLAKCEKQLCDIDTKIATGENRRELIERYLNVEHLTRDMVELLIEKIMVSKRIDGTRNVPIEIHWNF